MDISFIHSPTVVTVSLSSTAYSASENDGLAIISLELSGAAGRELIVFLETQNGNATGCLRG